MMHLPADFVRRIVAVRGEAGAAWIERLPTTITTCARQWSLTVGEPFGTLSYNYVVSATRADGTAVILKLCVPDREYATETAMLRQCDGRGIEQPHDADATQGAMLLERLLPGTPLRTMTDDVAATAIAATVMQQLWQPVPPDHPFPTVADWGKGFARHRARFGGTSGPLPAWLFARGESLFAALVASQAAPVLLHGDLHHDNILAAARRPWLAIDPKGVVGEPAYETGAWLRNPPGLRAHPDAPRILARRIAQFAEILGFERERIRDWAVAQVVLAAVWSAEHNSSGATAWITHAELLAAITC